MPVVTYSLISLNVLVFIWQLTLSQGALREAYLAGGVIPCELTRNVISLNTLSDLVTSMFMHGGWVHLISNMAFLLIFAPLIEDYMGKGRFLAFYMGTGFAASLLHAAINWNVCIPSLGASGAIYGVMGAFFLLYPAVKISTIAFFFRVPVGTVNVQAFYMLLYFFVLDLFNGLASLGVDIFTTKGVAFWAHVGGFITGLLIAFVLMIFKEPPDVDPFGHMDY